MTKITLPKLVTQKLQSGEPLVIRQEGTQFHVMLIDQLEPVGTIILTKTGRSPQHAVDQIESALLKNEPYQAKQGFPVYRP